MSTSGETLDQPGYRLEELWLSQELEEAFYGVADDTLATMWGPVGLLAVRAGRVTFEANDDFDDQFLLLNIISAHRPKYNAMPQQSSITLSCNLYGQRPDGPVPIGPASIVHMVDGARRGVDNFSPEDREGEAQFLRAILRGITFLPGDTQDMVHRLRTHRLTTFIQQRLPHGQTSRPEVMRQPLSWHDLVSEGIHIGVLFKEFPDLAPQDTEKGDQSPSSNQPGTQP